MTAAKTKTIKIPRKKVIDAVKFALPQGKEFDVIVENSALGGMKVVRVVTNAWKTLRPAQRISKVREAVESALSKEEQDKILRFSVLTPSEYQRIYGIPDQAKTAGSILLPSATRASSKTGARPARSAASGAGKLAGNLAPTSRAKG